MRDHLGISEFLEGFGGLVQQHLTVSDPQDLFLFVDRILQEPHRCRISLTTARRKYDQRAERWFLVDLIQASHGLFLMFIGCAGVSSLLWINLTV